MCGSSSTTTTVPLSALTFLAFHLPPREWPECGIPYRTMTIAEQRVHAWWPTIPSDERSTHAHPPHRLGGRPGLGRHADGRRGRRIAPAAGATTPAGNSAAPTTLAGIKAKAATDITDRVNALNAAIAKVNGAKGLGSGQAALASYLGADIAPLQQLNTTIQADTTVQQAAHDFGTIFSDYRVYVLVLPAARIAADADRATTTAIPEAHHGRHQGAEPT